MFALSPERWPCKTFSGGPRSDMSMHFICVEALPSGQHFLVRSQDIRDEYSLSLSGQDRLFDGADHECMR